MLKRTRQKFYPKVAKSAKKELEVASSFALFATLV